MSKYVDVDELCEHLDIFLWLSKDMALTKDVLDACFGTDLDSQQCTVIGNYIRSVIRDVIKTCTVTEFDLNPFYRNL